MERHPVKDVVVVVPGIGGSRLERAGLPIWGTAASMANALRDPVGCLGLCGDGSSPDPTVTATGLLGRMSRLPGLSAVDAYDGLTHRLRERFDLGPANYIEFPYDWRLSCGVNALLLAERVRPVLAAQPGAQLVFICHSMGGLVVQHFTDLLGGAARTRRVITMGTPFRGAAKAAAVLVRGWPQTVPLIRERFRRLALTLPSFYDLLPRYRAVIDGRSRRSLAFGDFDDLDEDLFDKAATSHRRLDAPGPRAYARTVIVGALQPTGQFLVQSSGRLELREQWTMATGVVDRRGDGTVPRQGLTPPEWLDDTQAMPFPVTHVGLPTSQAVFGALYNVLTAQPRADQADGGPKLALRTPDLVEAGTPVEVACAVAEGRGDLPLLVEVASINDPSWVPRLHSPTPRGGWLVAIFPDLPPGDFRVTVVPALPTPTAWPVWDVVTVIDPALEAPTPAG